MYIRSLLNSMWQYLLLSLAVVGMVFCLADALQCCTYTLTTLTHFLPSAQDNQAAYDDPRLVLINDDAKAQLEQAEGLFDIIIGDLADPLEGGPCYQVCVMVLGRCCWFLAIGGVGF